MHMFKYFTISQYLKAYGIESSVSEFYESSLVANILAFLAQNCFLNADLCGYAVKTGYKGERSW